MDALDAVKRAQKHKTVIPAFNIPYLPMVKPVVQAIKDENSVAMIQVARLEWEKFESKSLMAVAEEYSLWHDPNHTLLHLDHVPVIDEDYHSVDFMSIMERAVKVGYQSVMIDGSRLSLSENIEATKHVAEYAHRYGVACEAELGSVAGHENGGLGMTYEQLFCSKEGFTKVDEAKLFALETQCDWLSVAAGSIHGAIADNLRKQKKPQARLDIKHIAALRDATNNLPLVLHGGSGIIAEFILQAIENGIAKINVATDIRQPYESTLEVTGDVIAAQEQVYQKTRWVIHDFLRTTDNRTKLYEDGKQ